MCELAKRLHTHGQIQWLGDRVHPLAAAPATLIFHSQLGVWGGIPSPTQAGGVILLRADLELGTDARRLLLLVEVEQRLGDAVGQRQVAEVLERLHAD